MRLPIRPVPAALPAVRAATWILCFIGGDALAAQPDKQGRYDLNIEARPVAESLVQFQQQTGLKVWCRCNDEDAKIVTNVVRGSFDAESALDRLLADTGGAHARTPVFVLVQFAKPARQAPMPRRTPPKQEMNLPEVFVNAGRTLNRDITRTSHDATPYEIYDADQIRISGYATVGEFLRSVVTANVPAPVASGPANISGTTSQLDLRGMGSSQTVILIDGRRQAGVFLGGTVQQPDIDAIPSASVARIEVFKATASARAGAGAVAGVVNIVLHREAGAGALRIQATRLASAASASGQISAEKGVSWADGERTLSWSAGYLSEEDVQEKDERSLLRGRSELASRHPEFVAANPEPPLGAGINFHARGTGKTFGCVAPGWDGSPDTLRVQSNAYCFGLGDSAQDLGGAFATRRPAREVFTTSLAGRSTLTDIFSTDLDLRFTSTRRHGWVSALDNLERRAAMLSAASSFELAPQGVVARVDSRLGDGVMTSRQTSAYGTLAVQARFSESQFIQASGTLSSVKSSIIQPWLPQANVPAMSDLVSLVALQDADPQVQFVSSPDFKSSMLNMSLLATTSLWNMGAGPWQLTITADRRRERLADASATLDPLSTETPGIGNDTSTRQDQRVTSYQGELRVPLLGTEAVGRDPILALELAVRHDTYLVGAPVSEPGADTRFRATTYIASAIFRPLDGFAIRAGCGSGFQPPPITMLTDSVPKFFPMLPFTDPVTGELLTSVTVLTGGNRQLKAEHAETCTGGLVVTAWDDSLHASIDFVRLLKTGVVVPPEQAFFSRNPSSYIALNPDRIQRQPTAPGASTPGKIERIDSSASNIGRQDVRAIDLSVRWQHSLREWGTLELMTNATAQPVFRRRTAITAGPQDIAGIIALAAPRYRAFGSAVVTRGHWSLGWATRFTSSSRLPDEGGAGQWQAGERIPSQLYHDLFLSYSRSKAQGGEEDDARGWEVRLDARNFLGGQPPYDPSELYLANRYGESERRAFGVSFRARF